MNSDSHSARSSDTYSHRLADIVGTIIALVTLILPVFVIGHYSNNVPNKQEPMTYKLPQGDD